ncbi:MAG TPA: hypothetical protein VEC14_09450 [Reyranellaceae bacterium]|nr:hypothetical protein [Reyranellaceae bacterium]
MNENTEHGVGGSYRVTETGVRELVERTRPAGAAPGEPISGATVDGELLPAADDTPEPNSTGDEPTHHEE